MPPGRGESDPPARSNRSSQSSCPVSASCARTRESERTTPETNTESPAAATPDAKAFVPMATTDSQRVVPS